MAKYNKNILEEIKKDTEEKVAASEDNKINPYQDGEREALDRYFGGKKVVQNIPIPLLSDNPNNHFHRIEGEKWEEFVGSIKEYGVINPLIVRGASEGKYEILAGHNRKYAAIEVGLTEVPCIITDVDDVDASVIVGITNNQREETSDLEWGWAYRTTLEALRHQGKRSDDSTSRHDGEKLEKGETSISIVAQKYGVGERTAQRKIRLTYLIEQLYDALVKAKAPQGVMVDLSYLTKVDQANLASEIAWNGLIISEDLSKRIKSMAQEREGEDIGINNLYDFVRAEGEKKEEAPKRPKKYLVNENLFPKELKKQEREGYIEKALLFILQNGINLTEGGE